MIAVIAAMDKEVDAIVSIMENCVTKIKSNITLIEGTLAKRPLIVMKSGVGKGSASMATTILLENYNIDRVINIGTAGGLCGNQSILDAVVSTTIVQHDFDTSPVDGKEGIGLYFEADHDLGDMCEKALQQMGVHVHRGLIASGDTFVAHDDVVEKLMKAFPNAICAEMEAGAIAQVCTHYQIPFVVLRSLSDIACHKNSHMDFTTYVEKASMRSATFCLEFMKMSA